MVMMRRSASRRLTRSLLGLGLLTGIYSSQTEAQTRGREVGVLILRRANIAFKAEKELNEPAKVSVFSMTTSGGNSVLCEISVSEAQSFVAAIDSTAAQAPELAKGETIKLPAVLRFCPSSKAILSLTREVGNPPDSEWLFLAAQGIDEVDDELGPSTLSQFLSYMREAIKAASGMK